MAGVVLKRHLKEVCGNRNVTMKRNPQISDLNDSLKGAAVIDTPRWCSILHLGDIRNLCAHDKESEPTTDQINDLLAGGGKSDQDHLLTISLHTALRNQQFAMDMRPL